MLTFVSQFSFFREMEDIYSFLCVQLLRSSWTMLREILFLISYRMQSWQSMNKINQKCSQIFTRQIDLLGYRYLLRYKYQLIISAKISPIFNRIIGGSGMFSQVFSTPSMWALLPLLAHRNALTFEQFMSPTWVLVLAACNGLGSSTCSNASTDIYWLRIFLMRLLYRLKILQSSLLSLDVTILGRSMFSQVPIHFYPAYIKSCNFSTSCNLILYSSDINFLLFSIELAMIQLKHRKTCLRFSKNKCACGVVTQCQLLKYITNSSITSSQNSKYTTSFSISTFMLTFVVSFLSTPCSICFPFISIIDLMLSMLSTFLQQPSQAIFQYWRYFLLYWSWLVNLMMLQVKIVQMLVMSFYCFCCRESRIDFRDWDVSIWGLFFRLDCAAWKRWRTSSISQWQGWAISTEKRQGILDLPHTDNISMTLVMLEILRRVGPTFEQHLSSFYWLFLILHLVYSILRQETARVSIRSWIPCWPSLNLSPYSSIATLILRQTFLNNISQSMVSVILFLM